MQSVGGEAFWGEGRVREGRKGAELGRVSWGVLRPARWFGRVAEPSTKSRTPSQTGEANIGLSTY